jgi:exosortase
MELTRARTAAHVSYSSDYVCIAAVAALLAALYGAVLGDLASEWWNEPASSYGMLVPPIAAWIAWQRRRQILRWPAVPDWRGLAMAAFGCLCLITGKLAAEFFLARISLVFVLAGIVWTLWGIHRFRELAFPFILLCTMVPLPVLVYNALAGPLQLFASDLASSIAQSAGVSVFRDGNIIHLANASLGVEEACSGLQSLSAMVVASLLLGFLEDLSKQARILLFLSSVPLAIAVNVLRVAGTAVIADYQLEYAMGFYHLFAGWLVFVAGFGALWLTAKLFFHLGARRV